MEMPGRWIFDSIICEGLMPLLESSMRSARCLPCQLPNSYC